MQTIHKMTESLSSSFQDDKVRVYGVGGDSVFEAWQEAGPLIETSLPYAAGKYSLDDIKGFLLSLDMQLWIGCDGDGICGACVTQIVDFPQSKRLTLLFFGGRRLSELLNAQTIFRWGKELGCSHVEVFGRPGWERLFKRNGHSFEKIHTVLQMKL